MVVQPLKRSVQCKELCMYSCVFCATSNSHQCDPPGMSSPVWLCERVQPSMWLHLCPHFRVSTRKQTRPLQDDMFISTVPLLLLFSVCSFSDFVSREPNKTQVFSFFQTDLGGFLPRSVVDSFFPSSMAEFYSNLAKSVKSLKDF